MPGLRRRVLNPALCRRGDLLSAIGALVLGVALALLGHPLLAATAGLLHALGKLGSALHRPDDHALPGWAQAWPDPFRSAVLLSRVPATLVAAEALATALLEAGLNGAVPAIVEPGVLLVCYALWSKADLMLFRPGGSRVT